jgi:type VI secretion system secreted protein Hcp
MAMLYYLKMKGAKQGDFKSAENTQKGREGWIRCSAFENGCDAPFDAQSGMATGKRRYEPIKILKEIDSTTPLLWAALTTNENIPSAEFYFFRPSQKGIEEHFYTIKLTNARVGRMKTYQLSMFDVDTAKVPMVDEVEFTFQKIEWEHKPASKMASDDWEAPVA